jgi:DNA-binding transcriptional regulator YiaG
MHTDITVELTNMVGDGGAVVVPATEVEDVLDQWFPPDDRAADSQAEDAVSTVVRWARAHDPARDGGGIVEALAYLGINAEMHTPPAPRRPDYRRILTRRQVERLTRDRLQAALAATGTIIPGADTEVVRLAYIQDIQGLDAMRAALAAMEAATTGYDPRHRELVRRFTLAHEEAHERWLAHRQQVLDGRILPGRVIEAIRTGAGMSPAEWADALSVSEGTARDWESGRRTPPAGACTDMWAIWLRWVKTQAAALGTPAAVINQHWREPVAVLPADTPLHDLRALGIMLQGRRFTLDPGPEIQHPTPA